MIACVAWRNESYAMKDTFSCDFVLVFEAREEKKEKKMKKKKGEVLCYELSNGKLTHRVIVIQWFG